MKHIGAEKTNLRRHEIIQYFQQEFGQKEIDLTKFSLSKESTSDS